MLRKGIKILGKVVSAAVLLLIIFPLFLSLLLDIPFIQNFVVHKAAEFASRKLQTTVSIDRVNIGLFNKIKIDGFYVQDYQKDTLLYVGRLDAVISEFGIFSDGLVLRCGDISDAKLYLRETPSGDMNIKEVVDRIGSKNNQTEPTKEFKLTLNTARIRNLDFCLEHIDRRNPAYGIDFTHMHLYGFSADLDHFILEGSRIHTKIKSMSVRERSGFEIRDLSGIFFLTSGCLGFENTTIVTANSHIEIPQIALVGDSWADYTDFVTKVQLDGELRNTTISTDDIAYFSPKLREWHTLFSEVDLTASGFVADFAAKIHSLHVGTGTSLVAEAKIKGLPDIDQTHFDLSVSRLTPSAVDVDELARNIAHKTVPNNVLNIIDHTGNLALSGRFEGLLSSFTTQMEVSSLIGNIRCDMQVKPLRGDRRTLRGTVQTQHVKLGALLGQARLGRASLTAHVDGVIGKGYSDAHVRGAVSQLEYNNYAYDSLRLDGHLHNKQFDGRVSARDAGLNFDFAGLVDFNSEVPQYDFQLDLHKADLVKMHINQRDSISLLSARIAANASGRSLDDMNGQIRVTEINYRYDGGEVTTKKMIVSGDNEDNNKFVELKSDFADATFRSKTSYKEIISYLKMSAWKYLPMLYDPDKQVVRKVRETAVANDYSLLSVKIKNINPIAEAVSQGLQIADGSQFRLIFNPADDKLSFSATSDYIERDRMLITRLHVNAANRGDSLAMYVNAEDFYVGTMHFPQLSVMGGAEAGRLQLSLGFNDSIRKVSGLLGLKAAIAEKRGPNGRVLDVHILPSHLTRGAVTWQILARKITLDTAQVVVDHFFVSNDRQHLLLNGVASRSREDSLVLSLRDFDLAPFTQFVEPIGYKIEGRTNGTATVKSALKTSEITADIRMDSVKINAIQVPPLLLQSQWDFRRNRAGIIITNRTKQDTLVRGFYAPTEVRYYAKATIDSLNLGLLDPILKGSISHTSGWANADVVLQGEHRATEMMGTIHATGVKTTVDFTGVTYTLPEAVLQVKNNRFTASNVPLYDPQGNTGQFAIDLNLQHLSNIAYTVTVAPQKMLVLNTTEQDNDQFYGKIYATGLVTISGNKRGVNMNITAATDDNSSFYMPLSNKSNIASADFVTFATARATDTINYLAHKKMMFERKHRAKSSEGGGMDINLALDVRPNLDFQLTASGNQINGRGDGELNLHINPKAGIFEMLGDYTITQGNYLFSLQNIINRKFIIEAGSTIQWTGDPLDAMLNIDAIYKVKTSLQPLLQGTSDNVGDRAVPVDCVIHLGNKLSHPSLTFDVKVPASDPETQTIIANALSTPETIDTQFAYLLITNSFLSETSSSNANIGVTASAATGLEFLTNQLSRMLSVNDYNVVLRYRPKSELTSDEVDFGLSKSLINNRLFVEFEGNYIMDNKQAVNNNMSNFMGEAYVTWLIDRGGTLRLKCFTQTIDRFDENQGLQETGVGIYYKEDFNNFKDLRQRVKDHFTSKKRKAKRAAKAAERQKITQTVNTQNDSLRVSVDKKHEKIEKLK
ncbi:MAG: translocation/assembly module TamB domain-containing protein [Alistipes sp.]